MRFFARLGCDDAEFIRWLRYAQQSAQDAVILLDATYPD
jgi:hypothetical protein